MDKQKSDFQLVKATLEDADNFAHIIAKYEKQLFVYIKRLTNISNDDAEDILQEVFIKIYENLNDFDESLKFSSWIYRIAHNHTISSYRKNKKSSQDISLEDNEIIYDKLASELNLHEETDKKLLAAKVKKLLLKLDEKYREVLILKYLEDKDYTEISNILKKPMGTIATLMNRAKAVFRKTITENNITF
ncbi:sigma-70 family RNA polymerase sigma factor [Candidatus Peregrinibacteria bacterium]|nr:sigma-70 family RNA polymerase sigma factor [Candidatus Peregrinibacteria bacterium]MBT4055977.1 sigma-70 family RNA polymerase sigma factor [Candidatus Peregrinibacteria bacterium]